MTRAHVLLALVGLLALAACGPPMRWESPYLSDAQSQAEMGDCRQQAWMEAQNRAFFNRFAYGPGFVRGRDGRIYPADPWMRSGYNDTWFEEQRLRDFCLRNKGFRLVPAE
jgi:hypothetical protein